jgi:transposase-like protein
MLPPVVVEPDRSLVERPDQAATDSMAAKKVKPRPTYSAEVKAATVARALKAKETGSETWTDIAKAGGFHLSNIGYWVKQAKEQADKSTDGPRHRRASLTTSSRYLVS